MKTKLSLITIATAIIFSSCGINSALILNHNQNTTQVVLSSNNFKVIDKVMGTSAVRYVLSFGGLNKKQLYQNAYADMLSKANLMNGSKALINIVTEEHIGGLAPFYYKRTVTISANVIEFAK